jgi:GT2 family glycosyltransferase
MSSERNIVFAVILNYNSSQTTIKCISTLKRQDYPFFYVIVVDNCSEEKDTNCIKQYCTDNNLVFISATENRGYSAGNNMGIAYAMKHDANWVMIINPDVSIEDPFYISSMLERSKGWPQIGAMASNGILPNGLRQNPIRIRTFNEEFFWTIESIKHRSKKFDHYLGKDITGYCQILHGSCLFLSAEYLREVPLLDENVFLYCEEEILADSVTKAGFKMLYIRECTYYHNHIENNNLKSKKMKIMIKSRKYYFHKVKRFNCFLQLLLDFSFWLWSLYYTLKKD